MPECVEESTKDYTVLTNRDSMHKVRKNLDKAMAVDVGLHN